MSVRPGMNLLPASVVDGHFVAAERRAWRRQPGSVARTGCRTHRAFVPSGRRCIRILQGALNGSGAARVAGKGGAGVFGTRGRRAERPVSATHVSSVWVSRCSRARSVDDAPLTRARACLEIDATRMVGPYRNEVLIDA